MPYADPEVDRRYHNDYKRRNRHRYRGRQRIVDAARHANMRAIRFGAVGTISLDDAAAVLSAGACHYCGGLSKLELDHVVPLSRGGVNRTENIVAACDACNSQKADMQSPWAWSRHGDRCTGCGTSERKHIARGLCGACYQHRSRPLRGPAQGERSPFAKLTEASVAEARRLSAAGWSLADIGARIGVSKSQAERVVNRKSWKHVA